METDRNQSGKGALPMIIGLAVAAVGGAAVALLATGTLSFGGTGDGPAAKEVTPLPHAASFVTTDGTLREFWNNPIHPMGAAPAGFTEFEAELVPSKCGACHQPQLQQWTGSRHSLATGPGIHAQMLEYNQTKPLSVPQCSSCHYPLWEQHPTVSSDGAANPAFNQELYDSGISCAVCHVRDHVRFGPERTGEAVDEPPHGGFEVKSFYSESRFCARCHQFRPGAMAFNGKLIENTFEEWKASKWAEDGMQCQGCHMPDRQHLFRGIHDKETVLQALTLTLAPIERADGGGRTALTVANSGAGHHFPTYVTPAVYIRFRLEKDGAVVNGSPKEHRIQRRLPINLAREEEDTRIAAGASSRFDYSWSQPADQLVVEMVVNPDEFYRRFYENRLEKQKGMADDVRAQYEKALAETHENVMTVWTRVVPLGDGALPVPVPVAPVKPETPVAPVAPVESAATDAAAGRRAREIYDSRCTACHGPDGDGNGPAGAALTPKPASFTDKAWQAKTSDERIETVIVEGGPALKLSPLMPPNPDLADEPAVVRALREIVRDFGR